MNNEWMLYTQHYPITGEFSAVSLEPQKNKYICSFAKDLSLFNVVQSTILYVTENLSCFTYLALGSMQYVLCNTNISYDLALKSTQPGKKKRSAKFTQVSDHYMWYFVRCTLWRKYETDSICFIYGVLQQSI